MDTEQIKKMIAKVKDTLKQVFDVEDSDFVVQGSTREYTAYSVAHSEFALKQYIYYIIKPTNHKTRFKLRLRDDKIKFEIKIFEDFPVRFENFDFSMPIFVGNEVGEIDKIYQPIAFRDCNIKLVSATAINNTFVSQGILFERCDIKALQIHKTIFAEEISFYENVILYVSLSNCIFQKNLYFNHSILKEKVDFHESEFEKVACFYGAKFKKAPNFSACYFKEPRAVNLVNIDIDSLDFKQVEDYIKDNFKDEWCKQKIAKNRNKEKEIKQEYRLKYAKSVKDSFRAIKDILIGQNNTLEAQKWHKLELYAEEKELEINLTLKRKQKDSSLHNNILMWFNCVMLQFYRMTSDHHTNFISILHFTIGIIVLYGLFCYLLFTFGNIEITDFELKTITLCCIGLVLLFIFFTKKNIIINLLFTVLACCVFLIFYFIDVIDNKNNLLFYSLVFILSIFLYCVLFACANTILAYLMRGCLWLGFLWVLFSFPQLNNPFIGVFSFDKSFEKENVLQQKLSDLNSSTIINLAKISQKDFTLQNDYDVSFAELNSAKMMILSNKNNITALKDENLTKVMEILGHTLYSEISQAIKQDEIVGDIIKSTSIIYSIILLLCIFSIQKTARKNSIIPS